MINTIYTQKRKGCTIVILFLIFCLPGFLFADTEYTQYMNSSDITAVGSKPNPSDPKWSDYLKQIITAGEGIYWQGTSENGDCYLQFDLSIKREVNCFKISFYQQSLRRYRFKITYNNTLSNPNGVYYTVRGTDWSTKASESHYVSYYLDTKTEARYFRIYFYGNDTGDIHPDYVRVDEVRIWYIDAHIVTPNANCEWHVGNSY
jgi:hypothetical protein